MDKKKKAKTKPARESAAANKSSAAGKRSGQGSKAARNAPSKAPADKQSAPTKRATPAAYKGAGQKSKSTSLAKKRSQAAASSNVVKSAGQSSEPKTGASAPAVETAQTGVNSKKAKQGLFQRFIAWLRKPALGKIYKTTDGYFNSKPKIDKPRRVAVIDQRRDDKAVAVVKIFSEEGKSGKSFIANLTLTPEEHKSLTKNSRVGNQVYIGVKQPDGSFKPILTRDLEYTGDELTSGELKTVKSEIQNDEKKHRKTYKKKMRRWKRHFK